MRSIRSAGAALTLAGIAFAGTAVPAFAAGPQIDVTPSIAAPGTSVTFSVVCGASATSATLFGTTIGLSEHIPMGPATHKGVFVTTVRLPQSIATGNYAPSIDCSNGMAGTAALKVNSVPIGTPVTGDGVTATAVGGPLSVVGVGLLGLAGLAGLLAVRRRAANASK